MEKTNFLDSDVDIADSDIAKKDKSYFSDFWTGGVKKWVWPFSSQDSEICCISRDNL